MQLVTGIRKKNRNVAWVNAMVAAQLAACWICVLLVPGVAALLAYVLLKFVFAPIGLVLLAVLAYRWFRGMIRSRELPGSVLSLMLSVAMLVAFLPMVLPMR